MSGTGERPSRSQLCLRSVQLVGAAAVAAVLAIPVPLVRLGLRVNYTLTGESDAADCGHADPYDSWEALQRDPVTWLAALWVLVVLPLALARFLPLRRHRPPDWSVLAASVFSGAPAAGLLLAASCPRRLEIGALVAAWAGALAITANLVEIVAGRRRAWLEPPTVDAKPAGSTARESFAASPVRRYVLFAVLGAFAAAVTASATVVFFWFAALYRTTSFALFVVVPWLFLALPRVRWLALLPLAALAVPACVILAGLPAVYSGPALSCFFLLRARAAPRRALLSALFLSVVPPLGAIAANAAFGAALMASPRVAAVSVLSALAFAYSLGPEIRIPG